MTEITTTTMSNDLQQNLSSETVNLPSDINETLLSGTGNTNPTSDSIDIDEPPTKKCKIASTDKPRLLEDRIGSILSCCICLDLSILPIYQVINMKFLFQNIFFSLLVYEWTSNVCFMF
jgi:hypothetical protein